MRLALLSVGLGLVNGQFLPQMPPASYESVDDDLLMGARPMFNDDPAGVATTPWGGMAVAANPYAAPPYGSPYFQPANAMQPSMYASPYGAAPGASAPYYGMPAQQPSMRFRQRKSKKKHALENMEKEEDEEEGSEEEESSEEADNVDKETATEAKSKSKAKADAEKPLEVRMQEVSDSATTPVMTVVTATIAPAHEIEYQTVIPESPAGPSSAASFMESRASVTVGAGAEEGGGEEGKDPLDDPLEEVKHDIIAQSNKIKEENGWIAQVEDVITKYQAKVSNVKQDVLNIRGKVKDLLVKKRQIQNLKLQKQLQQKLDDATADMSTLETALEHVQTKQKNFVSTKDHLQDTIGSLQSALGELKGEPPAGAGNVESEGADAAGRNNNNESSSEALLEQKLRNVRAALARRKAMAH